MKYKFPLETYFSIYMTFFFQGLAAAEVGDKVNSVETMYDAALLFGIIFSAIIFFVKKHSRRASWIVFSIYGSLVLIWNISDIWVDADIRGAIFHELGGNYYWHESIATLLAIALAIIPLILNKSKPRLR